MNARPTLMLLMALAMLGGCLARPDVSASAPTPYDAAQPFTFSFTSKECIENDIILLIDKAAAQQQLPTGFRAADASSLTGAPLPGATGKGAVLIANIVCPQSSIGPVHESAVNILIETPKVNGTRTPALFDLYEKYRIMAGANESAPFAALGWEHGLGDATSTLTTTGGAGTATNGTVKVLDFTTSVAPGGPPLAGIGRFWQALDGGLGYVDYKLSADQRMGSVQCLFASGSAYAKVAGAINCAPGSSAGMLLGPYALDFRLVNLPGAKAT